MEKNEVNIRMGLFKTWTLEHKQIAFMFNNCMNDVLYTCYTKNNVCFSLKKKLLPTKVRYRDKHIGLSTKRFIDSLGSC